MQKTWVPSLGWEDPLEKGMAAHSIILAWRIPWTEEPDGLESMGSQRVRHNWMTNTLCFHKSEMQGKGPALEGNVSRQGFLLSSSPTRPSPGAPAFRLVHLWYGFCLPVLCNPVPRLPCTWASEWQPQSLNWPGLFSFAPTPDFCLALEGIWCNVCITVPGRCSQGLWGLTSLILRPQKAMFSKRACEPWGRLGLETFCWSACTWTNLSSSKKNKTKNPHVWD